MEREQTGSGSLSWVKSNLDHTLSPEDMVTQREEFEGAIRRFILRPPDGSSYSVAMGEALLIDYHDENFDEFRSMIDYLLRARQEVPQDQKLILYRQILVYELFDSISGMQDMSPLADIDFWRSAHRNLLRDISINQDMRGAIDTIVNQTNIPQRYAGAVIAINAVLGKDRPLRVLDIGSSSGLGLAQLYSHIPFDPFKIEGVDSDKQQRIRRLLEHGVTFEKILGIDKSPVNDFKLAEAQATQLAEFSDRERAEKRQRLYQEVRDKKIRVIHHDVLFGPNHPDNEDIISELGGTKADAVMELTAFYEIPDFKIRPIGYRDFVDAKQVAIDSMQNLISENGLLIVQDYAQIDPHDKSKLRFAKDIYHPASEYGLYVMPAGEEHWVKLGTWDKGRCNIFYPAQALFDFMEDEDDRRAS